MKEIEIYSPALSETYIFNLDENTPLGVLAEEASSMLKQRERSQAAIFYSLERGQILDGSKTLEQLGLSSGAQLCIV